MMGVMAKLMNLLQQYPETKVFIGVHKDVFCEDMDFSIGEIVDVQFRHYAEIDIDDDRFKVLFKDESRNMDENVDWQEAIFVAVE